MKAEFLRNSVVGRRLWSREKGLFGCGRRELGISWRCGGRRSA
jgi:hypothetical protein